MNNANITTLHTNHSVAGFTCIHRRAAQSEKAAIAKARKVLRDGTHTHVTIVHQVDRDGIESWFVGYVQT